MRKKRLAAEYEEAGKEIRKLIRISKERSQMASIKRGEVFLVNFDPTSGAEDSAGVVVSNNVNNAHSPIVSIAPITSNVTRVYSFEVEILPRERGLRSRSKVTVNQTSRRQDSPDQEAGSAFGSFDE